MQRIPDDSSIFTAEGKAVDLALDFIRTCFCLFDLNLYVHSTIFQLCGTGLPGLNQY